MQLIPTNSIGQSIITTDPGCDVCAITWMGPRLASFNSEQGALSNAIFGGMLGKQINLSVLDWERLIGADISWNLFLGSLSAQLSTVSATETLTSQASFNQIKTAIVAGSNDGTIASILNVFDSQVTSGTVQLGQILRLDFVEEHTLLTGTIDAYNLIRSVIELYNNQNALITETTINPSVLGITDVNTISLYLKVLEPPVMGCITSDQLQSANIRMRLEMGLNESISTSGAGFTAAGTVNSFDLYLAIAEGKASASLIDASKSGDSDVVGLTAEPSLANAFIGFPNNYSFYQSFSLYQENQISVLDIGAVTVTEIAGVLSDDMTLSYKALGQGSSGSQNVNLQENNLTTIGSSSTAIGHLGQDLSTQSEISLQSNILPLNIVNAAASAIKSDVDLILFGPSSNGPVYKILENCVDPLLKLLGIGIGEMDIQTGNVIETCYDYGDAPASYGTLIGDGGPLHVFNPEERDQLKIGPEEIVGKASPNPDPQADSDPSDTELTYPNFNETTTYSLTIPIVNNYNQPAYLVGWIDWNGNGKFDNNSSERSSLMNVSSTPGMQDIELTWSSIPANPTFNSDGISTYLRLRLVADQSFAADPTPMGFFEYGEVEDHGLVFSVLPLDLLSFKAKSDEGGIVLTWNTNGEYNVEKFIVQRSTTNGIFQDIATVNPNNDLGTNEYQYIDKSLLSGKILYRLKMQDIDGYSAYSQIANIQAQLDDIAIYPNPFMEELNIMIPNDFQEQVTIQLVDSNNKVLYHEQKNNPLGSNSIGLGNLSSLPPGYYLLRVMDDRNIYSNRILKAY